MSKDSISVYFAYEELGRQVVLYKKIIFVFIVAFCFALLTIMILAVSWEPQTRFVLLRDHGKHVSASLLPVKIELDQKIALYGQMVGQYVKDRHTIDNVTDDFRHKTILASQTGTAISVQMADELKKIKEALHGSTRSIEIRSVVTLGENLVRVDFRTIDLKNNEKIVRHWEANASYRILTEEEFNSQLLQYNPSGLVVEKYSLDSKD
jgi:type IV secretory pathway component VirB8